MDRRLAEGTLTPDEAFTSEELEHLIALYDGCIAYMDDRVADLFEYLRDLGVYDDSLILITSNHGEEFLEHGRLVHLQVGYEELTRIPLMIKFPNGRFEGRRLTELVAMVDLMPTILGAVAVVRAEQESATRSGGAGGRGDRRGSSGGGTHVQRGAHGPLEAEPRTAGTLRLAGGSR